MIVRARAPSVSRSLASSLPEGAFDTRTFCPDFLFVFCLSAIAFIEPHDYRGVFYIQQKEELLTLLNVCFVAFSFENQLLKC